MKRIAVAFFCCAIVCGCSVTGKVRSSRAPIIGISAAGTESSYVGKAYIDAVSAAGGVPVIIPIITDSLALSAILNNVDGVLMTGGEDIDPDFYGETALPQMGDINATRDTFDLMLARMTVARHKPLMGICRGHQAINVAFGGSLWQDIPSQIPASQICHRTYNDINPFHDIYIQDKSLLSRITTSGLTRVNTFHHQAVKDIADSFSVTATAPDGVVEAIECICGGERIIGVQFHPEKMHQEGDDRFLPLFEWLVEESRK